MSAASEALTAHLDQLAAEVKRLQQLARPPRPPRWPWLVVALLLLGGSFAVWHALHTSDEEQPPIVAPITPTGDAAQRLWLP